MISRLAPTNPTHGPRRQDSCICGGATSRKPYNDRRGAAKARLPHVIPGATFVTEYAYYKGKEAYAAALALKISRARTSTHLLYLFGIASERC